MGTYFVTYPALSVILCSFMMHITTFIGFAGFDRLVFPGHFAGSCPIMAETRKI